MIVISRAPLEIENTVHVVITDLDGTLLGADYRPGPARSAVRDLITTGIPLIFCSSKTRTEQETIRADLGVNDPFIVENGAAILIPPGYFNIDFPGRLRSGYHLLEFAVPYSEVRERLKRLQRERGLTFRGFGNMCAGEVARLTGLDIASAQRAKQREYSETVVLEDGSNEVAKVVSALASVGLECLQGSRFFNVHHGADKGRAVVALIGLFRRTFGTVTSIGIGDGPNDVSMLRRVDLPAVVRNPTGGWVDAAIPDLRRIDGVGPEGFVSAVRELVR
jgi:mannosyl-3-phosphoglycerate phosphatase